MKLHPRVPFVQKAHNELAAAVSEIIKKYELTYGELWSVLNEVEASWIKYCIRDERHPDDPDKPGGLE
jgi:hypothetical protein